VVAVGAHAAALARLKPSGNIDILRVPFSLPRTKPKACNFALQYARGEFVTIFDAEDDPDPRRNAVDPALFHAVVDGYRDAVAPVVEKGSVEDAALDLAGPLITYEQALRFLTDYLQGDVYYRTTRPGQNLDRTRAQLALLASMQGTVGS
jgi:hypothetical protein